MRSKFILLCLFVSVPLFTQANETEIPIDTLHVVKQSLDEVTFTEDGMYEISFSEEHLPILLGAFGIEGVDMVPRVVQAGLKPLRNWQEYLLDMSDDKTLDQKMTYLFEHQDEFGLDVRHFAEGTFNTSDNLIRKGGYAITLRNPIFSDSNLLFVGRHQDSLFMNVVQLTEPVQVDGIGSHLRTTRGPLTLKPLYPPLAMINDVDYTMDMERVFLKENFQSRRSLIKAVTERADYSHVISPGQHARNANGRIVKVDVDDYGRVVIKRPHPSFLRRLLRKAGLPIAVGISLSSLFFANDAEAQTSESEISEDIRIEMTPEEFEQANEEIDLALDSYYSTQ